MMDREVTRERAQRVARIRRAPPIELRRQHRAKRHERHRSGLRGQRSRAERRKRGKPRYNRVAANDGQHAVPRGRFMTTRKTLTVVALIALSVTSAAPSARAQRVRRPLHPTPFAPLARSDSETTCPTRLDRSCSSRQSGGCRGAGQRHTGRVGRRRQGFGKRYASLVGQGVIQESVTYALSEALAVDSRFHKSDKHDFLPRAGDALVQAVTSRRANGTGSCRRRSSRVTPPAGWA